MIDYTIKYGSFNDKEREVYRNYIKGMLELKEAEVEEAYELIKKQHEENKLISGDIRTLGDLVTQRNELSVELKNLNLYFETNDEDLEKVVF